MSHVQRRRAPFGCPALRANLWAWLWAVGLWPIAAAAQWTTAPSSRAEALAQAITAQPSPDAAAAQGNPALIAWVAQPSLHLGVVQHPWVSQLSRISAAAVVPWPDQAVGVAISSVGLESYRETLVGGVYARRLGRWAVGTRLGTLHVAVPEFGSRWWLQADVGVAVALGRNRQYRLGARTANLSGARVGQENPQSLPWLFAVGAGWQISSQLAWTAEWQAHNHPELSGLHSGIEYVPVSSLALRLGVVPQRNQVAAGVGWQVFMPRIQLRIDVATRVDPTLGWVSSFGVNVGWLQKGGLK